MQSDPAIPPKGLPFGDYVLLRHLARGGMAEIFEARSPVGRPVVVKRIRPKLARDPQFVKLFLREAAIAMRLSHGNIAQVFDFGEVDGEYYLAMEYVPGVSLYRLHHHGLEQGLLIPFPIAAHVVAEICRGLDHAHRLADESGENLGIVHRDVTPQNILVSYEGEVKLVDFGIARARTEANLTKPGVARGKYAYLSPEQVRQRPLDRRTDVWACGVVLHEILTGEHPFRGEVMDVLEAIAKGRLQSPRAVDRSVPEALSTAVMRAMAHDANARLASARELEAELVGWLHAQGPPLTAATLAEFVRHVCPPDDDAPARPTPFPAILQPWRRSRAPADAPDAESETDTHSASYTTGTLALRRKRTWGIVGAALAVAAGLVLFLASREGVPAASVITSDPPGASILLDGFDSGRRTPHRFEDLERGRTYGLTLALDGHYTHMGSFVAGEDVHEQLAAREERAEPPTPRRPALSEVLAAGRADPTGTGSTHEADLERVLVDLAEMPLARHPLDPARVHRFSIEGGFRLVSLDDGDISIPSVLWYATYPDGPDRTGFFGGLHGNRLTVEAGAVEIRFGVIDRGFLRPSGGQITIRGLDDGSRITLLPHANFFLVGRSRNVRGGVVKIELDPSRISRVRATIRGDLAGGPASAVMFRALPRERLDALVVGLMHRRGLGVDRWAGVLEEGVGVDLEGFGWFDVFLPHADPETAAGMLTVTIEDVGRSHLMDDEQADDAPHEVDLRGFDLPNLFGD